jgi:hypothetical protein
VNFWYVSKLDLRSVLEKACFPLEEYTLTEILNCDT